MTASTDSPTANVQSEPHADSEPTVEPLTQDDIFHLLQNERRRAVLRYLAQSDEDSVRMRDVAEQVAAWENDTTVQQLHSDERQRVYIALYQTHLPKLDDSGVIEYNQSRGIVTPTNHADQLYPFIETANPTEAPATQDRSEHVGEAEDAEADANDDDLAWSNYYLGLSSVSALLLGAISLSLVPAALLSSYLLSVLTVAAFGITALGQRFL
ncbi:hypothetical protein [Haladaptatus sp. DYSN1]|uniref:DUF7344 domain-containing protein n=1 Tax=unclassified Haladaptatus TaxID=2622732 RepID=UPI002406BD3B|nr:hypothetical protein [Haladaptatus sp. DYSN1]